MAPRRITNLVTEVEVANKPILNAIFHCFERVVIFNNRLQVKLEVIIS